jgi:uncharacterized membrane protein
VRVYACMCVRTRFRVHAHMKRGHKSSRAYAFFFVKMSGTFRVTGLALSHTSRGLCVCSLPHLLEFVIKLFCIEGWTLLFLQLSAVNCLSDRLN